VPTHISANLSFAHGQSATSVFSFDSPLSRRLIELTGTEATLAMPDPNTFGGDLLICRRDGEWRTLESTRAVSTRGTGVLDMARALRENRPHRASGVLAAHVLDSMLATVEAAEQHQVVAVESSVGPAEMLPDDWDPWAATL
jgi:predicted dehydrogenase